MKIAFIFPPMWSAVPSHSLGLWNYQITSRLAECCNISVYTGRHNENQKDVYHQGVQYKGISINFDRWLAKYPSVFFRGNRPPYTSSFFFIAYAFKVGYELRRQKCDIIHIYNYPQFVPIIKKFNTLSHIALNIHGELLSQFEVREIDRYLRKADVIISCSEFLSRNTRERFPKFASRCETVCMGVDPDRFFPKKATPCVGVGEVNRLLYVGRLSPEKGAHVLLDAFSEVVARYPETVLDIVGSEGIMPIEYLRSCSMAPRHFDQLKEFYRTGYSISQLRGRVTGKLASRVTFHGHVPHNELRDRYTDADVYINPSYYESFGMSNIEAMACGVPVVATAVGAVPEVIEEGKTGILVEAGNSSALAAGIIRILYDKQLRNSLTKAAHQKAVSCFSWRSACEDLYKLYNRII